MGRVNLKNPATASQFPTWKDQAGMLGVRIAFLGATAAWVTDGTTDWFWPAAEKAGLPVMFLASDTGPEFSRIAEQHPRLTLIVDHMGLTPDVVRGGRTANAIQNVASLARAFSSLFESTWIPKSTAF
jgi:predicted TIM-barrel fold metal-dependent hydrolase